MERIKPGDMHALALQSDRFSRIVLGIGLRILRDAGEAHELVQDVFRYLSRRSHGFQGSRSCLRSWLFQIAYSHAFNRREYLTSCRFHDHCHINEEIGQVFSDCSPQAYEELSELRTVEVEKGKRNKILSILREFQYTAVAIPTAVEGSPEIPPRSCQVRAFWAPLYESQKAFRDLRKALRAFRGLDTVVLVSWCLC